MPPQSFGATVSALHTKTDAAEGLAERHAPSSRVNDSDGAGALVRAAPAGLLFGPDNALLVGAITAAYTHGGSAGHLAAAALARILSGLIHVDSFTDCVAQAKGELAAWPAGAVVLPALDGVSDLSGSQPRAVRALRDGINSARRAEPSIVDGIGTAAAEAGTSAAVVAGALLGAIHGASSIPSDWRAAPDVVGTIDEMSDALSNAHRAWEMGRDLPGWDYEASGPFEEHPACRLLWPRFPGW